ncbi:carbon-nitrogen hydrolase family protein [Lachnoclostridium sp. Marseille-P6806]|uniref:carbon-nitrogen hydrolase family protein n=1 Tax=Lachnoclostridium sp. Marseille-P6806 TaxID=2364793 RepID=UPI001030ED14|nr:carbon-nitrogen hydrolase family protein [Lachnoclostridium sp. Marseille-P6806]
MKLRIALLQLLPGADEDQALEKGKSACAEAKRLGADIALFPEMWSSGYVIPQEPSERLCRSVPADGRFVTEFGELAARLDMAVAITYLEHREPAPRNALALFDRRGRRVLDYAKVHTCVFASEAGLAPGEDFYAAELDTAVGRVQVGAMICFDREFPESARILMLKGAELILVPNACPMEINRLSQLRGRAYENMLAIATCNYPAGTPDCNGHSTVFDGVAYLPGQPDSRDTKIIEADEKEGIFMAELDLDQLRAYRRREVQGNAYRRPDRYGLLTERRCEEPFLRPDSRR